MDLTGWLTLSPIIAILRGVEPRDAETICSTLQGEGICIAEVPLNSPNALESISILSRAFGDRMLIGAGTLTTPKQVAQVAAAGGKLIVTPHADIDIVRAAKAAGLFVAAGCFSPTEAFALLAVGSDVLKLFPSEVFGIPMMKALMAVLPKKTGIVPVGGVNAGNISAWLQAGAIGVGVGSSIYLPGDDAPTVRAKARALMASVHADSVITK